MPAVVISIIAAILVAINYAMLSFVVTWLWPYILLAAIVLSIFEALTGSTVFIIDL